MIDSKYDALNDDQRRFVDAYVDGAVSAADAVIEAGFAQFEGYSEHDVARRLLGAPKIQAAIEERMKIVHDKGIADQFWMLRRLVDYANADYTAVFGADGAPLPPHQWPKPLRLMVRKVKLNPVGGIAEITFEPKTKILELIGRTDLIGAFEAEHASNETVVLIKDMTKQLGPTSDGGVIEAEAQRIK